MPATTENIPDKPKFDVYAMLVILTFVCTLGATLMLNDNLDKVWGYWVKPEERKPRALHLTQMNSEKPESDRVKISELDRKEWELAAEQVHGSKQEFTVSGFDWPSGYDPNQHPVLPNKDNLTIPEPALKALMAGYRGGAAAPAGEAPAGEAPKTEGAAPTPEAAPVAPAGN